MAKLTDARVATLQGFFDAGDQPTEAQFDQLILWIQEGIEEHDHDGTGDGDGIANLGPLSSLEMAEDSWEGIGAALERIVFNGGDGTIGFMSCRVGLNKLAAECILDVAPGSTADYVKMGAAAHGWRFGQLQSGKLWFGMGVKKNAADNNYIAETNEQATVNHRVIEISYTGEIKVYYQAHQADETVLAMTSQFEISTGGVVKIPNLAGVGNRNVVASAAGVLSAP